MKRLLPICGTLLILLLTALTGAAQGVHRVTVVVPGSTPGHGSTYVDAYEYDYVDVRPQFPGGERSMINFINNTREYPYEAYKNRVQGRVVCSFIVHADGHLTNIEVIRPASDATLNQEALRVISAMPKWIPGKIGSAKVAVRCVLPIAFRL